MAAAMIGPHVGYADIRAVADAVAHEMSAKLEIRAVEAAGFIAGRVAAIHSVGKRVGTMGELHPRCLEACGLRHAVAVFELNLSALLGL